MDNLYKTKQNKSTPCSVIQHIENQQEFDENDHQISDKNTLSQIINSSNYPSTFELDSIIAYCENTKRDDLGINLFFFKLSFLNNNFLYAKLYFSVLKRTCQMSSFVCDYFIRQEIIDCLVSHIFEKSQVSKNSVSFLIKILYKTKKRVFLLQTQFFSIFSVLEKKHLDEITSAFYSHTDEIDQNIFEMTKIYLNQIVPSPDIHKDYRFLYSLLQLSIKGIKIENIEYFINIYIDSKMVFMIEIILQLIPFSSNVSIYLDFAMFCLESSEEIIVNASIRTFSNIWEKLSVEQKNWFSHRIITLIEGMSFRSIDLVISLIISVRDWYVFNNFIFFQKIVELINQSDFTQKCLYAILAFLMDENVCTELKSKAIQCLCENISDLVNASNSPDDSTSILANALLQSIDTC